MSERRAAMSWLIPNAAVVMAATAVIALAGCGESGGDPGAASAGDPLGRVTVVAEGLDMPWGLAFLPDGSALVSSRESGEIHHVLEGEAPALVGEVPGVVASAEGGLLGLVASPDFERDRIVYAYVSARPTNRVVALHIARDFSSMEQRQVVLDGITTADRHHGGRLAFDEDGNLWITTGDAFDERYAPDLDSLNGKILRIHPDGSVPTGNPFETPVWSYGHRNVQGIAFAPDGTVYAAELGLNEWDELNVIRRGVNYGWPRAEGPSGSSGVPPIHWLSPEQASPSGIAYADGAVWMAALRGQRLWRLPVEGARAAGSPEAFLTGEYGRLRTVHATPDGEALWVTTSNTDEATLGGTPPREGDDRILRIELEGS